MIIVEETQHTIHDLLNLYNNFKCIYRFRDFLRTGYIKELYSIN